VGRNVLLRGEKRVKIGAKVNFMTRAGDVLRIETPGGGGWGRSEGKRQEAKGKGQK
jgi:N-methylhydantoinase B